ncbi:MAG: two-component system, OmpR family, sensor kinase [Actinomycetota bacterium]|jgi:two-component system sensor histidine kinase BaeS|nr:two-component system, OmpR family, sensor kinase [Actinomycetota bacterium]
MRRRLIVAIVGLVAGALLVAGLGTLLLIRRSARDEARLELVRQSEAIAAQANVASLPVLRRAMRLEGALAVAIGAGGQVRGQLPEGVGPGDIDVVALQEGRTSSGGRGAHVFAVAPFRRARGEFAIVLTQRVAGTGSRAGAYLLITGAASLAAAALVAGWLARRITRPLEDAEVATRRIAAGDLSAAVPVTNSTEPEVASLARSINTMAASLARAQGLERQFLMSVSHDLRTPLTSIRGFAEAITDGTATDPARAARVIASESRRLERLVGDLLDLAKLDARRFSFDVRPVDVCEVVADTTEGFERAASEAGVALAVSVPGHALVASVDPDRLAQVVANLVENALKFAATRIDVTVQAAGDGVLVAVADDGPGIPVDDLPHVFERLYQSTRTPARQLGSGLGLAIVAELVVAMGGRVDAGPGPDGGTRFAVELNGSSSSA